jgi:hypothetical protein
MITFGTAIVAAGMLLQNVSLDSGNLVLRIPTHTTVIKKPVNWETDKYTIRRTSDGVKLLDIVVGGGAYDLAGYSAFCLNHKHAWRIKTLHSLKIIIGDPGVNAASASYEDLSPQDATIANEIISSIKFNSGNSQADARCLR